MKFRAVIFDLDGTLLDTLDDIADSANCVLAKHGFPTNPVDDYRYFVGDGIAVLMTRILPAEELSTDLLEECLADFREEYDRRWNVKTTLYNGVAEMLDELTRRSLTLAVLSNKPDDFTKQCVAALLSEWMFEKVLGFRSGLPRKPDPTGAVQIADELGVPPAQILYLGDSGIDMQTATACGMFPVGALWGFRSREELEGSGAQAVIEHPQDLLALL